MTRLIPAAILLLPLAEIAGFVVVSRWIGLSGVLLGVIAGAMGGLMLLRRTGLQTVTRLRQALAEGREPGHSLIDGACFAAAGVLLIVPGFVSDLIALVLILPWTRDYLLRRTARRFGVRTYGFGASTDASPESGAGPKSSAGPDFGMVIETDFADVTPTGVTPTNMTAAEPEPEESPPMIDHKRDRRS